MDRIFRTFQDVFGEVTIDSPIAYSEKGKRWIERDAERRSRINIAEWTQYLPTDCIERMIAMGWDVTT